MTNLNSLKASVLIMTALATFQGQSLQAQVVSQERSAVTQANQAVDALRTIGAQVGVALASEPTTSPAARSNIPPATINPAGAPVVLTPTPRLKEKVEEASTQVIAAPIRASRGRNRLVGVGPSGALIGDPQVQTPAAPMSQIGLRKLHNGDRSEFIASMRELTRITFTGDRAVSARTVETEDGPSVSFEADETSGDLYLSLKRASAGAKVSIFVTTERGQTYLLVPVAADTTASTVNVVGLDLIDEQPEPELTEAVAPASTEAALVSVMRALYLGTPLVGFVEREGPPVISPEGLSVVPLNGLYGDMITGRVLRVTNRTGQNIKLDPKTFQTSGKRLLASSVESEALTNGASSRVFLIEER